MSLTVEAIYENGVLKPSQPIALPEGTRVSLVIETAGANQLEQSPATLVENAALPLEDLDAETNEWLEADLVEDLLPYNWGEEGEPPGKQVHYVPGTGFVVEGGKTLG